MWKRNLLFWSVVLLGLTALAASLSSNPRRFADGRTKHPEDAKHASAGDDWRPSVDSLNQIFAEDWNRRSVQPTPAADRLTVARRLALALMGTAPSLEEIRFLEGSIATEDENEPALTAAERLETWLDHVLRDGRFHDYFAERLARAYVGVKEGPFVLFRRRRFVSWLSDQLAERRPYDAVVRDIIAGDGLWTDQPETNFITVTIKPGQDRSQPNENELASRVSRAFLGVRIDCAECHDHPFDRWKQREFQGLAAFFAGTRVSLRGVHDRDETFRAEDRKTGKVDTVAPAVPYDKALLPRLDEVDDDRRRQLAAWVTDPVNRAFSRAIVNRVWALMLGEPLVAPVDEIRDDQPIPAALDFLADDLCRHDFQLDRLIRIIAHGEPFHRDSRAGDTAAEVTDDQLDSWAAFRLTRLRPEQVASSVIQASSLSTLDQQAHLVLRIGRYFSENDFIKRYGDVGEDELNDPAATIPQRLLMMNGKLVTDKTRQSPLLNGVTQIGLLSRDDAHAVETAYLTVLTRRPNETEREHFVARLGENRGRQRMQRIEDLVWALLNSTEFSWNH